MFLRCSEVFVRCLLGPCEVVVCYYLFVRCV